ncbi:biopolymer transport protein ExbB [Roseivirga pacifica]|uniref:Biopolymer transport protein ExbB n=1 Tax=Roseivirga pacifica TaxID=1267423 RepID=A0A1I0RG72_9BACT|nr:MotA/TolQ/ExbB proton channel family protein [Roseivirga pacifica]MCO6357640.1 MotA/TolQ/ExbB proton channel family protein [Roseivirga pacifica]MCO6365893.1 MotA/TolQ/ExbB proton channel family protein [Roseivirga pacifica]MCO6371221.1 MotA/TolQ/ExbB proton channel family protein [Roseivirga pacifica]MCO6375608.1 MotA/TolQ/ExbB proton channel family protein [Roseivirga pacifica]MCO6378599.1 MotA/TolQ/ExbB proton channel family protein [Roseivirga pacifica]
MKKLFSLLMILGVMAMGFNAVAQDDTTDAGADTTQVVEDTYPEEPDYSDDMGADEAESFDQVIKSKFIEGDPTFMSPVLICLILGLAIAIERIISLNLATTNTSKLLSKVEDALESGGVEAAKEVTRNTRGPVASIFTQGLMRMSEGIEMVEKSVIAYGSVEMGRLERGLVWISLFISLAPMLGFMGTVIGMIGAFDSIQAAGDISPSLVAGGIKVALLTTVAGLIVAIILQLFYNYCVSKIDSIVNSMEDASISLVDLLVKHNLSK